MAETDIDPNYPRIRFRAACPQPRDAMQHIKNAETFAAASTSMLKTFNYSMVEEPLHSLSVFLAIKDSLNAANRELDRACAALMFDPEGRANG
jgi:hypothetical protein